MSESGANRMALYLVATWMLLMVSTESGEARRRSKHADFETGPSTRDDVDRVESKHGQLTRTTDPKRKISWREYAKAATAYSKNNLDREETSYCHKVALKRCGNSFMKVFQLFTFLPEEQSFQAKCASRTAFYSCLKKFSTRPCMSSWHFHIEEKFRKRLADNLWSARTCVLGILPPSSTGTRHDDVAKH